jgi:hypothetical protein
VAATFASKALYSRIDEIVAYLHFYLSDMASERDSNMGYGCRTYPTPTDPAPFQAPTVIQPNASTNEPSLRGDWVEILERQKAAPKGGFRIIAD